MKRARRVRRKTRSTAAQPSLRERANEWVWPGLLCLLIVLTATVAFRGTPDFEELGSVTAQVESHEIEDDELRLRLEGIDLDFTFYAGKTDQFYAIVNAAEARQPLTLWTWPGALESKNGASTPIHTSQVFQAEHNGKILLSYEQVRASHSSTVVWMWSILLLSTLLLGRWIYRKRHPKHKEPRATRQSRQTTEEEDAEEVEVTTRTGMPVSARWFWDLFGVAVFVLGIFLLLEEGDRRNPAIPTSGDLIEVTGQVTDLEIETNYKHRETWDKEIAGLTFGLTGQEGRWKIPSRHWCYDKLARRLLPDTTVQIRVAKPEWLAANEGDPERPWSVQVGDELVLSLDQETRSMRQKAERPMPWLFAIAIWLVAGACFAHGRLWGRAP